MENQLWKRGAFIYSGVAEQKYFRLRPGPTSRLTLLFRHRQTNAAIGANERFVNLIKGLRIRDGSKLLMELLPGKLGEVVANTSRESGISHVRDVLPVTATWMESYFVFDNLQPLQLAKNPVLEIEFYAATSAFPNATAMSANLSVAQYEDVPDVEQLGYNIFQFNVAASTVPIQDIPDGLRVIGFDVEMATAGVLDRIVLEGAAEIEDAYLAAIDFNVRREVAGGDAESATTRYSARELNSPPAVGRQLELKLVAGTAATAAVVTLYALP